MENSKIADKLRKSADEIDKAFLINITEKCTVEIKSSGNGYAYLKLYYDGKCIGSQCRSIGEWDMESGYFLTPWSATFKIEKTQK
jgi:hypothetical protein